MSPPFIVMALPRSRSAWLAHYLSMPGQVIGHDLAVTSGSLAEFITQVRERGGTVETSAMLGWRTIRAALPEARIIVLRRPLGEVIFSFNKLGQKIDFEDLARREAMLADCGQSQGVRNIQVRELDYASTGKWLFERCLGQPWDEAWWNHVRRLNIQINFAERVAFLQRNAERLALLKAEIGATELLLASGPRPLIGLEPFAGMWEEGAKLGAGHFAEVAEGDEPLRPYRLDWQLVNQGALAGNFRTTTARSAEGELLGYIGWTVHLDPESFGLLVAEQGPWYTSPGAGSSLGHRLFQRSLEDLREMGVSLVNTHHRMHGRGADIGHYFQRLGGTKTEEQHSIWIGESNG